jgi:hypothetical protein
MRAEPSAVYCSTDFFVAMIDARPQGVRSSDAAPPCLDTKGNSLRQRRLPRSGGRAWSQGGPPRQSSGAPFACKLGSSQPRARAFDQDVPFGASTGEQRWRTGWLVTTSPIQQPGSDITLQKFAVWDSGDGIRLDDPAGQLHLRRHAADHDGARRGPEVS